MKTVQPKANAWMCTEAARRWRGSVKPYPIAIGLSQTYVVRRLITEILQVTPDIYA